MINMHALVIGERGAGKSTLIKRLTAELGMRIYGFETKKEDSLADEINGSPVYIYEAGLPHVQREDNLVGYCLNRHSEAKSAAFDRFAAKMLAQPASGGIIIMDELGFMESSAEAFCAAVMSLLDGSVPVIAAVKTKDAPFLNAVRAHPACKCFYITEGNRDEIYAEVLDFVRRRTGEEL